MSPESPAIDITAAATEFTDWFHTRIETMSEEAKIYGGRIGIFFDLAVGGALRDVRDRRAFKATIQKFEQSLARPS